jgi:hypothetical protein
MMSGCVTASSFDITSQDPTEPEAATLDLLDVTPAIDPIEGGALGFTLSTVRPNDVTIEIRQGESVVFALDARTDDNGHFSSSWDGHTADGERVEAGAYDLVAEMDGPEGTLEVRKTVSVVRAAFDTAWAEDDAGVSAERQLLYWAVSGDLQDASEAFAHLDAVDVDGVAQDLPAITEDLIRAPELETEPLAYTWDSRPILTLAVATQTDLGTTGLDTTPIDVHLDGWTVLSGTPLSDGVPVTLQADAPLGDGPGIFSTDLSLVFSATDDTGLTWDIGEQTLPVHIYLTLGPSGFPQPANTYRPWVIVLEEALSAIDGTAPDESAVLDALVDWVFNDLGLVYDTESGASFYSEYLSWQWDRPHFFLGEFLQRRNGSVINCSDAANILSAYANMTGVALEQLVILENFDLNQIKAIGGTQHTSCPFGPWGCGFSYHAVTSTDGGDTIWDATLALDGDPDPGQLPSTDLLVQSLSGDEYLSRLVRSGNAAYTNQAMGTLQ